MAPVKDDIFFATATEIHQRWRAKEFSAVELAQAFSDRLERVGPKFNALALSLREMARRRAADLDKEAKRERFRGPLHGVPYGVKDLLSVAGNPTTWGAKPYAGQVFKQDAAVVEKLNKAGALLIGKLSLVELAGGPSYRFASASLQGPGLNPWDITRWSGGSSSGSAAAVAAGIVPYALGSETSGSILTPAAYCGVTGLRPTYGLVSRYGAMALSWTLDKIGPLAHSAEDCGHVLAAIAGGDDRDNGSAGKGFYFAPDLVRLPADIRAGFAPTDFSDRAGEALRPALQDALRVFREMGLKFVETELPDLAYGPMLQTILHAEAGSVFEDLIESGRVDELADARQIAGLKAALDVPARDYLRAMRLRQVLQDRWRSWAAGFDVLIAPTRLSIATLITDPLDRPAAAAQTPRPRGLSDHIGAANLAGWPALALPCGFADGLPVSISLIGRPFTENTLLALGMEFQRRTDWHRRKPAS